MIALEKGNKEEIKVKMDEYALARKTKQPLEYPSAGSCLLYTSAAGREEVKKYVMSKMKVCGSVGKA